MVGCVPPSTRRTVRSVSSSVFTASRISSSVAAGSSSSAAAYYNGPQSDSSASASWEKASISAAGTSGATA